MDASQEAWLLLRGFLALAAVLLLAVVSLRFGLPWLVRQRASGPERQLHVEDVCLLDRNHRLYVVRWKEEVLLLATSQDRVDLVARAPRQGNAAGGLG
jgi:flagellar biogenesis protein FliO